MPAQSGDEIDSARVPGVAFGETPNREQQPPERPMPADRVQSVLRAAGIEAAGRTDQRGDEETIALESAHDEQPAEPRDCGGA